MSTTKLVPVPRQLLPTARSVIEQVDEALDHFLHHHRVLDPESCDSCGDCADALDGIENMLDDLGGLLADIECAHVMGRHEPVEASA